MNWYSLGLVLFRWLFRVSALAEMITPLARIWMRHYRWRCHLRAFEFDGVIDGGANIGEFAQIVRDTLPGAHLLCVEPHPVCAAQLRRAGYDVIEAALWNEKTTLDLSQDGPTTSSTVMKPGSSERAIRIETVRLCDLPIRGDRLLIKLDLQGAEPNALEALGELDNRCAALLVEVSLSPGGTYEAINKLLTAKGYIVFGSVNELFQGNRQIESDLLWIKREVFESISI